MRFSIIQQTRDSVLQKLCEMLPEDRKDLIEIKTTAHFYVSSLMAILTYWLDNNLPLLPQEINESFRKLVMQGLENFTSIKIEKTEV